VVEGDGSREGTLEEAGVGDHAEPGLASPVRLRRVPLQDDDLVAPVAEDPSGPKADPAGSYDNEFHGNR
jgi:hypothetical protein